MSTRGLCGRRLQRLDAGPPMAAFRKMGEKLGIVEKPDLLEQVGPEALYFEPLTATRARARALVERTRAHSALALAGEGVEEADQKEIRGMEREINQLTQAEKKIQKEIQRPRRKGTTRSARAVRARARFGLTRLRTRRYAGEAVKVLAREIVRTRRCKEKMCVGVRSRASCRTARVLSLANGRRYTGRAALNSTLMQLTTQVAIVKAAGCMQKSTEVRGPAACPRVGSRARQGSRSSARVTPPQLMS